MNQLAKWAHLNRLAVDRINLARSVARRIDSLPHAAAEEWDQATLTACEHAICSGDLATLDTLIQPIVEEEIMTVKRATNPGELADCERLLGEIQPLLDKVNRVRVLLGKATLGLKKRKSSFGLARVQDYLITNITHADKYLTLWDSQPEEVWARYKAWGTNEYYEVKMLKKYASDFSRVFREKFWPNLLCIAKKESEDESSEGDGSDVEDSGADVGSSCEDS